MVRAAAPRLGRACCARVLDTSAVRIFGRAPSHQEASALFADIFQSCKNVEGCLPATGTLLEEAVPVRGPATDVGGAE
jgi:hypothetical protein